jgi:hypothetical protein
VNPNKYEYQAHHHSSAGSSPREGVQLPVVKAGGENELDAAFDALAQRRRFSSATTRSYLAGANSSWRWHHAMPSGRSTLGLSSLRPAAS